MDKYRKDVKEVGFGTPQNLFSVGMVSFALTTSPPQTERANWTALHPEFVDALRLIVYGVNSYYAGHTAVRDLSEW